MQLTQADKERLEQWWQHALAHPQELPPGLELVHSRLVRSVGHGQLPAAGSVFVKLMWFPRAKDQLRYLLRSLPGVHEAAVFEHCRERGVRVPTVVAVRKFRWFGIPRASMLVTAGLPVQPGLASPESVVVAVQQLITANLFHPDLHAGNFLPLEDGAAAVVDLQSARVRSAGISGSDRRAMFAKLLNPEDPSRMARLGDLLEGQGVCSAAEIAAAKQESAALGRRELAGRIRRCLRESTEFQVQSGLRGTLFRRRAVETLGESVEGGDELVRYWIGDRCLEILDSHTPICHALYRGRWPRRHRLYVGDGGGSALASAADRLHEAYVRYQELDRS